MKRRRNSSSNLKNWRSSTKWKTAHSSLISLTLFPNQAKTISLKIGRKQYRICWIAAEELVVKILRIEMSSLLSWLKLGRRQKLWNSWKISRRILNWKDALSNLTSIKGLIHTQEKNQMKKISWINTIKKYGASCISRIWRARTMRIS
jgi:hypothetical protein